tara:strand:+ start:22468 stop:23493 length:1026 start_codon:yes stop_codon:yes gene_type:complete
MIKNNFFYFEKIEKVVFIGCSSIFDKLIEINKDNNIKTIVITSSDQAKKIDEKIKFDVFDKIDEKFKRFIKNNTNPDKTLFFSIGARNIFKKDVVKNIFSNNLINTHGTRLPLGRGEVSSWRILKQDRLDNQLFHIVDGDIDTGPIICNKLSIIPKECQTPGEIQKFRDINLEIFYKSFLQKIIKKEKFLLKVQPDYLSSYLPRLSTEENGWINWSMNPNELIRFINAFDDPYIGASTYLNRKDLGRLHIKSAQLHGGEIINHSFMTGIVIRHDNDWIVVSTSSKYSLIIEKVLNAKGENIISKIKQGDRFYTPINILENAKNYRAFFDAKGLKKNKIILK